MLESRDAHRPDRSTLDARAPTPLRRHRAGGGRVGPRFRRRGPRGRAVHHRRLHLSGRSPVGAAPTPRGCASVRPFPSCGMSLPPTRPSATATSSTTTRWPDRCWLPVRPRRPAVVTTVHGPLNEELVDIYRAIGDPVPHHRRLARPAPSGSRRPGGRGSSTTASTRRIFPVGDGSGDGDGPFCLFLGRMAPDKGAHRAIAVARAAGMRMLMAAKMREAGEIQYFTEQVEPLLGPDAVYLGRGTPRAQAGAARPGHRPAVPDPVERAVRPGHARGHGLRHAGAGLPGGRGPRGGRARSGPGSSATTRMTWWRHRAQVGDDRPGGLPGGRRRATSRPAAWWPTTSSCSSRLVIDAR